MGVNPFVSCEWLTCRAAATSGAPQGRQLCVELRILSTRRRVAQTVWPPVTIAPDRGGKAVTGAAAERALIELRQRGQHALDWVKDSPRRAVDGGGFNVIGHMDVPLLVRW
jgi:hypothetical protein